MANQQIKPAASIGCGEPLPRCCSGNNPTCKQELTQLGDKIVATGRCCV